MVGTQNDLQGSCSGYVLANGQGGSGNYDYNVVNENGVPQNPFALCAGNYVLTVNDLTTNCQEQINFSIDGPSNEIYGCTDEAACNYSEEATDDDGSCSYANSGYNCDGNCLSDDDGDGICDEFEVVGCQDAEGSDDLDVVVCQGRGAHASLRRVRGGLRVESHIESESGTSVDVSTYSASLKCCHRMIS